MKKFLRILFFILLVVIVLGVTFGIIDTMRAHNEEDPLFCFSHRMMDGIDYYAEVNQGLGYQIIRYAYQNQPEKIKIGTIFSPIDVQDIIKEEKAMTEATTQDDGPEIIEDLPSGEVEESGEEPAEVKVTTFDEKYSDKIMIEGMEEEVWAQKIYSKIGYSMEYFFELFEYTGFENHDVYTWKMTSGEVGSKMVITNISEEKAYLQVLEEISKEKTFEEISGEVFMPIEKCYYRAFEENEVHKVNKIYIISIEDLKYKVEITMPLEAQEGIGAYFDKMLHSIS